MSIAMSAHTDRPDRRSTFKVVVVGERAVGKTSLAIRYIKGVFSKLYAVTVGIEFHSKVINYDHQLYNMQIWDTAGQQSFKSLVKSFYNQACCIIIAYCDPKELVRTLKNYLNEIEEYASMEVLVFAVRTKVDLAELQNEQRQALEAMKESGQLAGWMDVSSKEALNVDKFFGMVESSMVKRYHEREEYRQLVDAKRFNESIALSKQSVYSTQQTYGSMAKKKKCCQ